MAKRSKSSGRWLAEHFADPFVRRARDAGLRSRAAFKLEELDAAEKLMVPGAVVVDLGAAPGGWSQYAARKLAGKGRVFALDLLPMDAIAGVSFLQGDFREQAVLEALLGEIGRRTRRPCVVGHGPQHQREWTWWTRRGLRTSRPSHSISRCGSWDRAGALVMKVFQGAGFQELLAEARRRFTLGTHA